MSDWAYDMHQGEGITGNRPREGYSTPPQATHHYAMQGTPMGDGIATQGSNAGRTKEQFHRFAGFGVGLVSAVSEHVLSHPCIVLRRQCQVHQDAGWLHLTPFTLFQTIFNIQRHQSVTTLWKGISSSLMVKGIGVATESIINEVTPFPKEVNRHSTLRKLVEHILLKGISFLVITPFYAASLVESVQSEIASERPGVFDCLRDGGARLLSLATPQSSRLLPVWRLFAPTLVYGLAHYVLSSLAKYTVLVSVRADMMEAKTLPPGVGGAEGGEGGGGVDRSLYEVYYPDLLAAFTGQLLADILLYPLETVLHRLYLQGTRTIIDNTDTGLGVVPIITRYQSATDCFWSILTDEGVAGFYKGFGALVLQYTLHVLVLKVTKQLFERLAAAQAPPPVLPPPSASSRLSPAESREQHAQDVASYHSEMNARNVDYARYNSYN